MVNLYHFLRDQLCVFGKNGAGGGRELVITAQLQANIEADGESTCATVFVQPDSEQKCLLGMNVLPDLGLSITRANGEPVLVKEDANPIVAHVKLVHTCAIPSLKSQFLKVQAECTLPESCKSQVLFEPKEKVFESHGLLSHEAVVSVSEDGCMYVPVQNCDGVSVHIEEGIDVGVIRCVGALGPELNLSVISDGAGEVEVNGDEECISAESDVEAGSANCAAHELSNDETPTSVCAKVQEGVSERTEKLLEALELPVDRFTESEANQLRNLIREFSDVFALDDSELGCTDVVHHAIDTGDHPPIKQQPYRTPAVHRQKIASMVADMEKQKAPLPVHGLVLLFWCPRKITTQVLY